MTLVHDEDHNNVSATYNLRTIDELYDEQKDIIFPVLRIKRISRPKNSERWEIIENGETRLSLRRSTITNADAEFLYTTDGVKFLLEQFKSGARTIGKLKESLQAHRKQKR
jgi:hypothetical protein